MKTFQFVGRPSDSLWQNYPRVIRARQEQWARHKDNARYVSLIARLIWAYIVHTGPGTEVAPFRYAIAEDVELGSRHQALAAAYSRTADPPARLQNAGYTLITEASPSSELSMDTLDQARKRHDHQKRRPLKKA
ncbi:hypothetical protein [Sphingomonas sp. UYP23]